jgi:Uma2 family endonuclease
MLIRNQYPRLTAAQYLELEQVSDVRREYVAGEVYAIAAADFKHKLIAGNIYVYLQLKLWESAYNVYSDTKVKIDPPLRFFCPDISVVGKIKDRDCSFKTHPCLIVEVTSADARPIERWEKSLAYQDLAPLTDYVIVSQDRVQVDVYYRNSQEEWQLKVFGAGESVELLSVGLKMPMQQIYEDVCFEDGSMIF